MVKKKKGVSDHTRRINHVKSNERSYYQATTKGKKFKKYNSQKNILTQK